MQDYDLGKSDPNTMSANKDLILRSARDFNIHPQHDMPQMSHRVDAHPMTPQRKSINAEFSHSRINSCKMRIFYFYRGEANANARQILIQRTPFKLELPQGNEASVFRREKTKRPFKQRKD